MSFNFKVGGTWRTLASGWVKVAGTWQEVQSVWVKVAGTWQEVYNAAVYTLTTADIHDNLVVSGGEAGVRVNADGTVDKNDGGVYSQIAALTDWVIPNSYSSNNHWVRFRYVSGDTVDFAVDSGAGALNTWYQVSGGGGSAHEMDFTSATNKDGTYDVTIATDALGSNIVAGPTNIRLRITYI